MVSTVYKVHFLDGISTYKESFPVLDVNHDAQMLNISLHIDEQMVR